MDHRDQLRVSLQVVGTRQRNQEGETAGSVLHSEGIRGCTALWTPQEGTAGLRSSSFQLPPASTERLRALVGMLEEGEGGLVRHR